MKPSTRLLPAIIILSIGVIFFFASYSTQRFVRTPLKAFEETPPRGNERLSMRFSYLHNFPLSKDLVVYSAHFDDRPRKDHSNITVFFIIANRTIFESKWITGCGVGNNTSRQFLVRHLRENILRQIYYNHKLFFEQLAVECYGLTVTNGSGAFITYKTSSSATEDYVSVSQKPLMIPAPRIQPTGEYNFTLVVCTKAHNRNVPFLPEFIRYQKTIGVDHIHLSISDTFIEDRGFYDTLEKDSFVRQSIQDGYMTIGVLHEWYNSDEAPQHSTILEYLDCMYHYRGTYDYVFLADTDDYFTPRIPGKTMFKHYIKEYCYGVSIGSCFFQWLRYFPDKCGMKDKVGSDGNVTNHLKSHKAKLEVNAKSVHSTAAVVDSTYHNAKCDTCLLPGYKVVVVPPHIAYVAHARFNSENQIVTC